MTIIVASTEREGAIALIGDSRISGSASTESGAKIFALPIKVVVKQGEKFRTHYTNSYGFAFAGSTLSALNAHACAAACLQNLLITKGEKIPSLSEISEFVARVSSEYIKDVVSRSCDGLVNPERFFFNALIAGYCEQHQSLRLFQIQPSFDNDEFSVSAIEMDVGPQRFYPIGSGSKSFVELAARMEEMGISRGAYGTMELLIALGENHDVGGWLQYGEAKRTGFSLSPTVNVGRDHPQERSEITFLGRNVETFGTVGSAHVGYRVMGPQPPLNWLTEALPRFRQG